MLASSGINALKIYSQEEETRRLFRAAQRDEQKRLEKEKEVAKRRPEQQARIIIEVETSDDDDDDYDKKEEKDEMNQKPAWTHSKLLSFHSTVYNFLSGKSLALGSAGIAKGPNPTLQNGANQTIVCGPNAKLLIQYK